MMTGNTKCFMVYMENQLCIVWQLEITSLKFKNVSQNIQQNLLSREHGALGNVLVF